MIGRGGTRPGALGLACTALAGPRFRSAGPDSGGYGFLRKDGRTVGAIGPLTEKGASPAWTEHGGRVRSAPFDVFEDDPGDTRAALREPRSSDCSSAGRRLFP
ncbi:hypothetical protein GCM10010357_44530 [Streptomyces luteireticuli]|uniref:Uncharacterized protein n=1 Tax=Streptomyces luteireticuli TaxID=173858 RepID=A0ABP3IR18_9ACTN